MASDACSACLKCFMVILNLLYFVFGVCAVAAAVLCIVHSDQYVYSKEQDGNVAQTAVLLLLGTGALSIFVSTMGCCGAIRESPRMLTAFMIIMVGLLIAEYRVGNEIWGQLQPVRESIREQFSFAIQEDYTEAGQYGPANARIDAIQQSLHCCGVNGPGDWAKSRYNGVRGLKSPAEQAIYSIASFAGLYRVPPSCCVQGLAPGDCEMSRQIATIGAVSGNIYHRGCLPAIFDILEQFANVVAGSVLHAVIGLQIVSILLSFALYLIIRQETRRRSGSHKLLI